MTADNSNKNRLDRRSFLKKSAAGSLMGITMMTAASNDSLAQKQDLQLGSAHLTTDGLILSPLEYSQLLVKLAERGEIKEDDYSLGGSIEELEARFAKLLGKEQAIFMPTGTLANNLALRALAGDHHRVIVQGESHIYNDSGDCAQLLSNLNLLPLADGRATFLLSDVVQVLEKTASGRVNTEVGVISIETPVRRRSGEVFDYQELVKIAQYVRQKGIKLHLDGARLFIASAYSGISPMEYAAHFDTVYISIYKYFNAASGAILAGPKSVIENMYHTRRMFGGGLPTAWPFAVVARHYLDGFLNRFKQAKTIAEAAFKQLDQLRDFKLEAVTNGTNLYKLHVKNVELKRYKEILQERGLTLRDPSHIFGGFWLCVNESINKFGVDELVKLFTEAHTAARK